MNTCFRALALFFAVLLTACGGGGGGGGTAGQGPAPSGPQAVVITEANAKPLAANALDAAQNTNATGSGSALPVAVQVNPSTGGSSSVQLIAQSVRLAANSFSAAALPTGVTVSQTVACTFGGTETISGHVASSAGLTQGDLLSVNFNNCSEESGTSLNGQISMTIVSGSATTVPFHVVISTTTTNLSVTDNGVTVVVNGSVTLDLSATTTSETIVATGASLSSRETVSGVTHTTTLRNFTQTQTISGSLFTGSLSATVETDSSRLGGTTVSYTITTPTPIVWSETTGTPTAGVIKVVGANNAGLLFTINGDGTVTIQLDANGDGVYEKTITSTTTELASLR